MYTKDEVFELTCVEEDLDQDGSFDCIASGRYGTFMAFNPKSSESVLHQYTLKTELGVFTCTHIYIQGQVIL